MAHATMIQASLQQTLAVNAPEGNQYTTEFPKSVCFSDVVIGGLIMSFAHSAACDFVRRTLPNKNHQQANHSTIRFFRPVFATPQKLTVVFKVVNVTKSVSTLHFEVLQNGKVCDVGYISLTDLTKKVGITKPTEWELSPPPIPVSIEDLEADRDQNWICFHPPFSPGAPRNPQSYMKWHFPTKRAGLHTVDHWVTPGWIDSDTQKPALWTEELIHFVVDNFIPLLYDLIEPDTVYKRLVAAGHLQREARAAGKDDRIWGPGLKSEETTPVIASSLSINTEIKRKLRDGGEKWLFMRATTKCLEDGRMDAEVILLDIEGRIVALSNHIGIVIPLAQKKQRKPIKANM